MGHQSVKPGSSCLLCPPSTSSTMMRIEATRYHISIILLGRRSPDVESDHQVNSRRCDNNKWIHDRGKSTLNARCAEEMLLICLKMCGSVSRVQPAGPRRRQHRGSDFGSASSTTCRVSATQEGGTHMNCDKNSFRSCSGQMHCKKSIKVFAADCVFAKRRLHISELIARVSLLA